MSTRDTSLEAYRTIEADGTMERREWQVYQTLFHHGPMTQNEVWQHLVTTTGETKLPKQAISPRFSFLRRRGCIVAVGERKCRETGFRCIEWDVTRNLPRPLEKRESELVMLRREVGALRTANEALRLRLAKWGRPRKHEQREATAPTEALL